MFEYLSDDKRRKRAFTSFETRKTSKNRAIRKEKAEEGTSKGITIRFIIFLWSII